MNSRSSVACGEGMNKPFKVSYLEWKQHQMSVIVQVHSALWIHHMVSGPVPDICLIALGTASVHSK